MTGVAGVAGVHRERVSNMATHARYWCDGDACALTLQQGEFWHLERTPQHSGTRATCAILTREARTYESLLQQRGHYFMFGSCSAQPGHFLLACLLIAVGNGSGALAADAGRGGEKAKYPS